MAELLINQPLEIATADGFHEVRATVCGPFAMWRSGTEQEFANEEDADSGLSVELIGVDVPLFALTHLHTGWAIAPEVSDESGCLDALITLANDAEIAAWFDNRDDALAIQRDIPPALRERVKGIILHSLGLVGAR